MLSFIDKKQFLFQKVQTEKLKQKKSGQTDEWDREWDVGKTRLGLSFF